MTIEEKIERALIRYLEAEQNIFAVSASFQETEYSQAFYTGCDTCGYGGDESTFSFDISYRLSGEKYRYRYVTIDGDPLGFFPTLIKYFEED